MDAGFARVDADIRELPAELRFEIGGLTPTLLRWAAASRSASPARSRRSSPSPNSAGRRPVGGAAASSLRHVIRAADVIERKRNGEELSDEEISELVLGYTRGDVPDYQMAAWCMAVYFKGLTGRETHALTDAMIRSGETLDLGAALGRRVVDKHSTGGVGDKTSLAVGPIVAACGVPFGKMSGPRARSHGRDARQARVDPGLPGRADDRRVRRAGARDRRSRSSARPATSSPPTRSSTRSAT